jgi:hypothetical protein
MRHVELIAMCALASSTMGCAMTSPYQSTASSLSEAPYVWAPLDKQDFYVPSDAENTKSQTEFVSCTDELARQLARSHQISKELGGRKWTPTREARVVDLVGCMKRKGWHLVAVEPIVVTSDA